MAINPEKVCFARKDPSFGRIVRKANVHICDGIGTALAVRLLERRRIPRVTGVGLFFGLLAAAEREGLSVFLLGAKPETNEKAVAVLRSRYPNLKIAGRRHGYFDDSGDVVDEINASGADFLFAALGSPRQERWLDANVAGLNVPVCMGVGGSFDILSGHVKRAPALCQKTGTEFLYRLVCEPRRWRRQLVLPSFGLRVLWEALVARAAPDIAK